MSQCSGNTQAYTSQKQNGEETVETNYKSVLNELKLTGSKLRSDYDQPSLSVKPSWFNETLFENAKSVYANHFMGINFAHLSGLLLLVRVNSIFRTLSATGKSDSVSKLFDRYYQTIIHVKKWYEADMFQEGSEAHRSLLIVRGMHNKVCRDLNDKQSQEGKSAKLDSAPNSAGQISNGAHISEYDIMITQFAFIGFIVLRPKFVGLIGDFSEHDLESMLHFWRVIGHYLGASEKFNLCKGKLDEVKGMCEAIMDIEYKNSLRENPISSAPGIMSANIVRSIKFIPMLTIYGMMKYLYELLEIDTSEFTARATKYSRLSHTLIRLVMTNLLGYKLLRMFNNGLTRLSIYLVGKLHHRFVNHLNTKYGQQLKAM